MYKRTPTIREGKIRTKAPSGWHGDRVSRSEKETRLAAGMDVGRCNRVRGAVGGGGVHLGITGRCGVGSRVRHRPPPPPPTRHWRLRRLASPAQFFSVCVPGPVLTCECCLARTESVWRPARRTAPRFAKVVTGGGVAIRRTPEPTGGVGVASALAGIIARRSRPKANGVAVRDSPRGHDFCGGACEAGWSLRLRRAGV